MKRCWCGLWVGMGTDRPPGWAAVSAVHCSTGTSSTSQPLSTSFCPTLQPGSFVETFTTLSLTQSQLSLSRMQPCEMRRFAPDRAVDAHGALQRTRSDVELRDLNHGPAAPSLPSPTSASSRVYFTLLQPSSLSDHSTHAHTLSHTHSLSHSRHTGWQFGQIRSFEVHDLPVRAARFVQRKNWIVCGSVSHSELCLPSPRLAHPHLARRSTFPPHVWHALCSGRRPFCSCANWYSSVWLGAATRTSVGCVWLVGSRVVCVWCGGVFFVVYPELPAVRGLLRLPASTQLSRRCPSLHHSRWTCHLAA